MVVAAKIVVQIRDDDLAKPRIVAWRAGEDERALRITAEVNGERDLASGPRRHDKIGCGYAATGRRYLLAAKSIRNRARRGTEIEHAVHQDVKLIRDGLACQRGQLLGGHCRRPAGDDPVTR